MTSRIYRKIAVAVARTRDFMQQICKTAVCRAIRSAVAVMHSRVTIHVGGVYAHDRRSRRKAGESAMKATGAKIKREMVELALHRLVKHDQRKNDLDLVGENLIDPDYDIRAVRADVRHGFH